MLGATSILRYGSSKGYGILNNYLASLASVAEYPFLIKNVALT